MLTVSSVLYRYYPPSPRLSLPSRQLEISLCGTMGETRHGAGRRAPSPVGPHRVRLPSLVSSVFGEILRAGFLFKKRSQGGESYRLSYFSCKAPAREAQAESSCTHGEERLEFLLRLGGRGVRGPPDLSGLGFREN